MNIEQALREAVENFRAGRLAYQSGNNEMAATLMEKAVACDPSRPEYHNDLAGVYFALGRASDAVQAYRAAAALDPNLAVVQYNLGNTLWSLGQLPEAEQCYRRAVALDPDFALAHSNLGSALNELGRVQEAAESLGRAVALVPDYAEAHSSLGNVLLALGRLAEAERSHRKAVALRPELAIVHSNLGCLLLTLGRLEEAEQFNRRALALEPGLFDAHCNLGNALASLGRLEEAEQSHRRALELRPEFAIGHYNLGNVLMELGRLPEAEHSYRQAVALRQDYAEAHTGLGNALNEQDRRDEALASHRRAAELRPDDFQTRFASCMRQIPILYGAPDDISKSRSRYAASLAALREDLRLDTPRAVIDAAEAVGNQLPFFLAYQGMNNRELHSRYGDLVCTIMAAWLKQQNLPAPAPRASGARRIRIGIVSAHFRQGSVWNVLTRGMVLGLDRTKFELFGYHTSRSRDSETDFAQASLDGFRQGPWPLLRWLELLRDDAPDVLIYPEIGMDPMTTKLAALRIAPLQAAMWGHPDTTGLPTIDYYLSGELLEPPGAQAHYSERLVTLPNLGCSFRPIPVEPAEFDLAAHGIPDPEERVLYLSCQAGVFKHLPQHDEVFPRIARAVGNCCFVFIRVDRLFDQFYARLDAAFSASALDIREYCVVIDALPRHAFLGLMTKADVYLDTLSFSGFTTGFQALQCGLPIVTMEGEYMRGRLASGLLRRLGIVETVAADVDGYVSLAVGLARDSGRRSALKRRIASQLPGLFHDAAPLRAMERFIEDTLNRKSAL